MLWWFLKVLLWPVAVPLFRMRFVGREKIPRDSAVILASKHASYLDPVILGLACPRPIHFMAKKELFGVAGLRRLITWLYAFPVDRKGSDREALRQALRILEEGGVLGLFPEGKRVRDATLGPLKPGVAHMAVLSGAPIVPVALKNTHLIKRPGKLIPHFPQITVEFGEPLRPRDVPRERRRAELERIARELERNLGEMLEESA